MKKLIFTTLSATMLLSCKKDEPVVIKGDYDNGILVMNEGLYQQNNASISFFDYETHQVTQQVFYTQNGRGLGDLANDWEYYTIGDSAYFIIAVDLSSQLEIVNARTMKSVKQIPVFDGTVAREPRIVKVQNDKAYSINYDGTVSVVDLKSNTITNTISVGANPDGAAIVGNYLYTANSGGLNWPDYDSTISVVNLTTETEEMQFYGRTNCSSMITDSQGDIYVLSNGNYGSIAPAMLRIDTQTNSVSEEWDFSISSWAKYGEMIYFHDANLNGIYRFNTLTETFDSNPLIDCSSYTNMYSIHVGDNIIVTTDAEGWTTSSTVRVYDGAGIYKYSFTGGFVAKDVRF
ncbi:hypothetical protein K6119_08480 [Paracrocinitomix mangrovi]|uniref:YncE family protein n=1 Tax=Paracrocinitomix mangrovi TaxID=2862509 RepID=UPI001C8D0C1E|nr:DUF5074 domain-containing protein [Paracrocinitomix mangrovi]UKN03549.1 hypothetical protein K6119_08480 [Paracrocinitomix mangrovi]